MTRPSILLVCSDNVHRSALAAALLAVSLPGYVVTSAGLHPSAADGRPIAPGALAWVRTVLRGITPDDARVDVLLSDHRSRLLTPTLVRNARYIFTFDRDNVRRFEPFATYLTPGAEFGLYLPRQQYLQDPGRLAVTDPRYSAVYRAIWLATPVLARVIRTAYTSGSPLSEVRGGGE